MLKKTLFLLASLSLCVGSLGDNEPPEYLQPSHPATELLGTSVSAADLSTGLWSCGSTNTADPFEKGFVVTQEQGAKRFRAIVDFVPLGLDSAQRAVDGPTEFRTAGDGNLFVQTRIRLQHESLGAAADRRYCFLGTAAPSEISLLAGYGSADEHKTCLPSGKYSTYRCTHRPGDQSLSRLCFTKFTRNCFIKGSHFPKYDDEITFKGFGASETEALKSIRIPGVAKCYDRGTPGHPARVGRREIANTQSWCVADPLY